MKRLNIKALALLLVLSISVLVFASCGDKDGDGKENSGKDGPISVELTKEELTLVKDEMYPLGYDITYSDSLQNYKVLDAHVSYSSSAPEVVSVENDGKITALALGEAVITVTVKNSSEDESFVATDTVKIKVTSGTVPLCFDFTNVDSIAKNSSGVYVSTIREIDISENLKSKEGIDRQKIVTKIQSGSNKATLEDGVLTLTDYGVVIIRAYVGNEKAPECFTEIKIGLAD